MKRPWSISTTVRNPERLRDFLRVLKELEGQPFNRANQAKYQILLIQHRLYEPTDLTSTQDEYFADVEKEMSFEVAKTIFENQQYKDPSMRGRNSVAPLNKMGFCVAKESAGPISITQLGNYFLSEEFDLGKVFFIHFLKWQLPNPDSKTFSGRDGFNIKPFIGTLHLIQEVNRRWQAMGNEPIGLSKEEFCLFAPTLINYENISMQAETLINFRSKLRSIKGVREQKTFRDQYEREFVSGFLASDDSENIKSVLNNLFDYGDNAIRYFRLTRYIYIRGGGYYIDLEARRGVEIKKLLEIDDAAPKEFSNVESYINYIADLNQPVLPWETEVELREIAEKIIADITTYQTKLTEDGIAFPASALASYDRNSSIDRLKTYIESLREYRKILQDAETRHVSQSTTTIQSYIEQLRNIYSSDAKKSIELERLTTLSLNALNDAVAIKPNYPVGDDNEPTFTAPANKPDIECYYKDFNGVCEVTMLTDRSQWYSEGQPVMRHIRDFEDSNSGKEVYCLFIAPRLHQDTVETFWIAVKHGYRGEKQKIIPLSISQLIEMLETLLNVRKSGRAFTHDDLLRLYENVVKTTETVPSSDEWMRNVPIILNNWKKSLTEAQ